MCLKINKKNPKVMSLSQERTKLVASCNRLGSRPDESILPEEKIRIVLEGFRREVSVSDLCRREGIKPSAYYAWTKEFIEAGKERLTRDAARDATRQEVTAVKRENAELKHLVAELSLEAYRLKKTSIPPLQDEDSTT